MINRSDLKVKKEDDYNPEKIAACREYFHPCIVKGTVLPAVLPSINEMLEESTAREKQIWETKERRSFFKIITSHHFEGYRITQYMNESKKR